MEDLSQASRQFKIFCSYMIDPDSIINTINEMQRSKDQGQNDRAQTIYKIIASYFEGKRNFREDMNMANKDAKTRKLANYVEIIMSKPNSPEMQNAKSKFEVLKKNNDKYNDNLIIQVESENPIDHSDLVFLNQLAAITENTPESVGKLTQFSDRYYKQRIRDMYQKNQYYFEQAFCNTDILVQERILNILDTEAEKAVKARDEKKKAAYEFLEELYLVSSIDKKMLKSNAKFTKDKAFESFLKVLQNKEKKKTIGILINDDSIMKAILDYKYNNKGSLSTLKHLFIHTEFPYNRILLEKYAKLMKRSGENLRKDLKTLRVDEKFAEAYDKFCRIEDIEILKENSAAFVERLDGFEPSVELLDTIAKMIEAYCEYIEPIEEILSVDEMKSYIAAFCGFIIKHKAYDLSDHFIKVINDYFTSCVNNEFYYRKSTAKFTEKKNVTSTIKPSDIWYEINHVLYYLKDKKTKKVMMKFPEATYEFEPFGALTVSDKMVMRSDMLEMAPDEIGVDMTFERIKNVNIYMYQMYFSISEKIYLRGLDIRADVRSKSFFKKVVEDLPDEIYEEDIAKVQSTISNYIAMVLLIRKDRELFISRFLTLAPEILRTLHGLQKSFKVIEDHIISWDRKYLLQLFKVPKTEIELLHNDIRKYNQNNFIKGIQDTMDRFMALAPIPDDEGLDL